MDHLAAWRREADRFVDLLEAADLDRPVPACPDWDVADLAYHVGWIHHRFAQWLSVPMTTTDQVRQLEHAERPVDDAHLPGWVREQVDVLDPVLTELDPDEPVWNFTRAPDVGAFFPRRLHHEMVVHTHDLAEAVGEPVAIDTDEAVDGVDELLTVVSTAGTRWPGERPATLQVQEDATGRRWRLRLDPGERAVADDGTGAADVTLRGDAPTLLLVLWRRRPVDAVTNTGDGALADAILAAIGR